MSENEAIYKVFGMVHFSWNELWRVAILEETAHEFSADAVGSFACGLIMSHVLAPYITSKSETLTKKSERTFQLAVTITRIM